MHRCLRCNKSYEDNDSSILRGCPSCGSIFFLYIKTPEQEIEVKKIEEKLEKKETTLEKEILKEIKKKKEVEEEFEEVKIKKEKFGIETIRIPKEGVYEINIKGLMENKPLIVLEKGKVYLIHLPSVFETEAKAIL